MTDETVSPPTPPRSRGTSGIVLGSVFGFEISLDYSWFIIFFLILGTFAGAVFPAHAPGLDRLFYLGMGLAGALLFFTSLLLHELAHAFMARARGIEVEGITLFIFGGMARTSREASTPGDEFLIAGVGPLASFALAALFWGTAILGSRMGLGLEITVVAEYLGFLNLVLAIFNLLPGFPLDGGRLLRAGLWKATGSMRRATRIAAGAGRALGWVIIGLGVYSLLVGGAFIGGLWLVFIGWFLGNAARMSYQQVLLQEMFAPLTASQAMSGAPETVGPDVSIDDLVHDYFLRRPFSAFPVTDDGALEGLVTLAQVRALPRDGWHDLTVADIMSPLSEILTAGPDDPMLDVLAAMRAADSRRVLVVRGEDLLGIISATDVARWLDLVGLLDEGKR